MVLTLRKQRLIHLGGRATRGAVIATVVLFGCDPQVRYAPVGASHSGSYAWTVQNDDLRIVIVEAGGLTGQTWVGVSATVVNLATESITIDSVTIVAGSTYEGRIAKRRDELVIPARSDIAIDVGFFFEQRLVGALGDGFKLRLRYMLGDAPREMIVTFVRT